MAINLQKFMARNPTLIGEVCGIKFYEHPILGGEVGMIAVYEGKAVRTDWYDLPRPCDIVGEDYQQCDFMDLYS